MRATEEDYDLAASKGIKRSTFYSRVYILGWDKDRAMNTPICRRKSIWIHWSKAATQNGIGYSTFMTRVHKGWTREEAATIPLYESNDLLKKRRKYSIKLLKQAEQNGISRSLFYHRIKTGVTPEEAATLPRYANRPKTTLRSREESQHASSS
ncbi:putative DNA-binding transcriptional regulator AlpA [Paenibacillus shirakamiensis]|uniref:DNA-binding transcriptional regulator AlpA n=1 Tax=Paenibacillus shirakamiensis TaxID=1265935 RepID=A0ABS4JDI8_9BACL|nr:hypothetical protein [Paenibacillus shirakamiensis]MBP1999740.1 putative DNA-binding transcriptional regulator AlpA [Paenibacillus shirakamiensis]